MLRWWHILTLALLLWASAAATEERRCKVGLIAELKVTMMGSRPMIDVKINGAPMKFMVDSGAFYSTINTAAAKQLKLPFNYSGLQVKGVAGYADTWLTTVDTLTLADTDIKKAPFVVASVGGVGGGLIGQNVLGLGDVEYDLPHGVIRLFRPHDCSKTVMAYWANGRDVAEIAIDAPDPRDRHTVGRGKLNGKDIRITFDTGASATLISSDAAARSGVKPGDPGVDDGGRTGGVGGGLIQNYVGKFDSFKLDSEEVRNARIRFGEMRGRTDMLLGADFFISHRVYVSNSQHKIFLTYEGGPIFSTAVKALELDPATHAETASAELKDTGAEPADADGFARRGAARLSAHETDLAVADLDKAVAMAPDKDEYRLLRANARLAMHQPYMALRDLDAILEHSPGNSEALLLRAQLRRVSGKIDLAMSDLSAADKVLPVEADQRLALGVLYAELDAFEGARGSFSQWLKAHPDHPTAVVALAGRCRALAFLGQDLDRGILDCNRAIGIDQRNAVALEGRGLARLRQGRADLAVRDLEAATALKPNWAEAQYFRGLARQASGRAADGRNDVIAAKSAGPRLEERMKVLGLEADRLRP